MSYQLRTGVTNGRIDDAELGTFSIDDHIVTVDDYETAAALADRHGHLSWVGGDPRPDADTTDETYAQETVTSTDTSPTTETSDDSADGAVDLSALDYRELQELAKDHDIQANQSTDDLVDALEDVV